MILVDAHERERNLESLTKEMNQEDLLLGLQAYARFHPGTCYAFAMHSDQQQ